jgi:hypothetical protein
MKHDPGREPCIDVFRQVLDHAVIDADDWMCGIVDDIEVEGGVGEPLRIVALRVGPGAWVPRTPALFAKLLPRLFGGRSVRVPWSEVTRVGEHIRLDCHRARYGLGTWDRKLGLILAKIPGSERGRA